MKQYLLKEIIKKKTSKEEFAIVTNLNNGESEIYQPEKELSKEFKVYEKQIQKSTGHEQNVDLEELVRDCAGGRDTDKCQEGAFLYVRDSETLRSINGRRSNGMHRIYVCGERNAGKVRYDSKQSQHVGCATLHDTTHHTHV